MTFHPDYPRPQLARPAWLNLNGEWDFAFDDGNVGLKQKWHLNPTFNQRIVVPFAFQSEMSGIGDTTFHDVVWYARSFTVPQEWDGQQIILHFGAIDYRSWVWVNGQLVSTHEGGHTPFQVDITDVLNTDSNRIVVRVEDITHDLEQPRGKQYWEQQSEFIYYTRTTGIWQTVWLEATPKTAIQRLKMTPFIDTGEVVIEGWLTQPSEAAHLSIEISFHGAPVALVEQDISAYRTRWQSRIALADFSAAQCWSPECPHLFDVTFRLTADDRTVDEVQSYFGMRKISVNNGRILLNNQPYYMKLVLDQGYFPKSLITPPSGDALRYDIEQTKAMGFNGARKHQKIEDPRYLYWADKLGLLVWGEMANSHDYSETAVRRITAEWQAAITRDYNHPCIVAWVPLNESWGVPTLGTDERQPHHALSLYHLTKSLDPTRLVISNDGWEHTQSDLCTVHDYDNLPDAMQQRYASPQTVFANPTTHYPIYVPGFEHQNAPIFISEFGGIAYRQSDWKGWGYSAVEDDMSFIERYRSVISTVLSLPLVQGFCYTQLTDVEQEINGLMTYDRRHKVDPSIIRAINEGQPLGETLTQTLESNRIPVTA